MGMIREEDARAKFDRAVGAILAAVYLKTHPNTDCTHDIANVLDALWAEPAKIDDLLSKPIEEGQHAIVL